MFGAADVDIDCRGATAECVCKCNERLLRSRAARMTNRKIAGCCGRWPTTGQAVPGCAKLGDSVRFCCGNKLLLNLAKGRNSAQGPLQAKCTVPLAALHDGVFRATAGTKCYQNLIAVVTPPRYLA
ncbi:hypothetical protein PHYPSEUDO_015358 [Phytophthora pseudosyringae]|uniref:Uncharacterized protein n=1 Tax=Phytophthora pseudosyringae TaxID=221518 RepID=A0A8T1W295_9STRA|nr:hypothetical protein PHYPSEUDO_015358 [Phytophthora pseudosyringae]